MRSCVTRCERDEKVKRERETGREGEREKCKMLREKGVIRKIIQRNFTFSLNLLREGK